MFFIVVRSFVFEPGENHSRSRHLALNVNQRRRCSQQLELELDEDELREDEDEDTRTIFRVKALGRMVCRLCMYVFMMTSSMTPRGARRIHT